MSPLPGTLLSSFADPTQSGDIGITQQPQNVSARENDTISFSVVATNTYGYPQGYQWYSNMVVGTTTNWVPIVGATSDTFTYAFVPLSLTNRHFRVEVSVPGKAITPAPRRC